MKKKGFTLIELLAVIIILAVIALIAMPLILNTIEVAKREASKASALGYIDAVERYMIMHDINPEKYPYKLEKGEKYYLVEDSNLINSNSFSLIPIVYAEGSINNIYLNDFITVKGDMPIDGYVVIGSNNRVESALIDVSGFLNECEDNDCTSTKSSTIKIKSIEASIDKNTIEPNETLQINTTIEPQDAGIKVFYSSSDTDIATVSKEGLITGMSDGEVIINVKAGNKSSNISLTIKRTIYEVGNAKLKLVDNQTYIGILYMDPTKIFDTNASKCDEATFSSETGKKDGCMRFYVFDEIDGSYKMILDHNTTAISNWSTVQYQPTPNLLNSTLLNDTTEWDDNFTVGTITAMDVAKITNNESVLTSSKPCTYYFDTKTANAPSLDGDKSRYAWLFDNTYNCASSGCNESISSKYKGYWTYTRVSGSNYNVWAILNSGKIGPAQAEYGSSQTIGIRPMLTVSTSFFKG